MRLYVSTPDNRIIDQPGTRSAVEGLSSLGGTTQTLELQFFDDDAATVPTRRPAGTVITAILKEAGKFDGDALAIAQDTDWTRPGSDAGFYTAKLNINTVGINALLHVDGNPANDVASVAVMLVLVWLVPDEANPHGVIPTTLTIYNTGWTGTEAVEAATVPALADRVAAVETRSAATERWLPEVSGPTGGTLSYMDGQPTIDLALPRLYCYIHPTLGKQTYLLREGTDATSSPNIIRPLDYSADDPRVFVLV